MPYTKRDLIEQSGLPDRTIRNYIARGLLPRPRGHGLAAEYDEDHMVRAVAIGRLRAEGNSIDMIAEATKGWSTVKFKRFVAKTEPSPEEAAPAPLELSPPDPPQVLSALPGLARPAPRAPLLPAELSQEDAIVEGDLSEAPSWRIYPLIAGLALVVDAQASPVVRRIAAEIVRNYGPRPRGR